MKWFRRFFRWFLTRPDFFWDWVASIPVLRRFVNRLLIGTIVQSAPARPYPYALWAPGMPATSPAGYTSWTGLTDRSFTGRHLPPAEKQWVDALPAREQLRALFQRDSFTACPRSSVLFCFFAQWFTDSFLRTHPSEPLRNTSNHEIDLCQIYGICASDTQVLRRKLGGKLKSQFIDGIEYPEFLFERDGVSVREPFLKLSYIDEGKRDFAGPVIPTPFDTPHHKQGFFATGLERGNSSAFYVAISTIFLREHNRLCDEIARTNPDWAWDDDRVFETARNTNIAQLLKIIIEDYINHISSTAFKLFVDVGSAERQDWYRTNRITAEFDILYRWHALVPNACVVDGQAVPNQEFRYNNQFLIHKGVERLIDSASRQQAGNIRLENTPFFLVEAELAAMDKSRTWKLRSYNAYRERFGLGRVKSIEKLTRDVRLQQKLKAVYGDIDSVELMVGLLAEDRGKDVVFGELMTLMVGSDAFSQALTNPLLAREVFGARTFSQAGLDSVAKTSTINQVVQRNASMNGRSASFEVLAVPTACKHAFVSWVVDTGAFFLGRRGWRHFFESRRAACNSSVFIAYPWQRTIVVLDQQAIEPLFAAQKFKQDYGFSWAVPPLSLVGGVVPSIFESGDAHDKPKALYMAMLAKRTTTLLSVFQATANRFGQQWTAKRAFSFQQALEEFAVEFLFQWYFGFLPETQKLRTLYLEIFSPFWRFQRFIPGSTYRKNVQTYGQVLAQLQASPGIGEWLGQARELGLSQSDDEIAKQLLFVTGMNSFLGMQNLSKSVIGELSQRPELCAQLRQEIQGAIDSGFPTSLGQLSSAKLPLLDTVLRETVRLHPPVSLIFGRATEDQQIHVRDGRSYPVRKGELMMGVLPLAMRDATVFADPETFRPERFDDPAASRGLIWPRGRHDAPATAHDRTCPGKDVSMELMKLLCIWLLPRYRWTLTEPPVWDDQKFSLNVAAPKGEMPVRDFVAV